MLNGKEYPYFAVLHIPVSAISTLQPKDLEVIAVFKPTIDVKPDKLLRFLTRLRKIYSILVHTHVIIIVIIIHFYQ